MDRVDCGVFLDQLDALVRGELPEDGRASLRAHASACVECAALLRMQEHLLSPSLAALEAQVPDAYVTSMWRGVRGAMEGGGTHHPSGGRSTPWDLGGPRWWLTSLLAAATVALLFANGLALRALSREEDRVQDLAEQVLDQQRRLVASGATEEAGRVGALPGFPRQGGILRALESRTDLTVADLRAQLREMPAGTSVISARGAGRLARSGLVPLSWREALVRLDGGGVVTAGELLTLLDDLALPPETSVPITRLLDLLT